MDGETGKKKERRPRAKMANGLEKLRRGGHDRVKWGASGGGIGLTVRGVWEETEKEGSALLSD